MSLPMSASYQELKQEMNLMRKRISALEKALDSILTNDDIQAIAQAHEDLKRGKTITLAQAKKKYS